MSRYKRGLGQLPEIEPPNISGDATITGDKLENPSPRSVTLRPSPYMSVLWLADPFLLFSLVVRYVFAASFPS
jgi:hypothetical protein